MSDVFFMKKNLLYILILLVIIAVAFMYVKGIPSPTNTDDYVFNQLIEISVGDTTLQTEVVSTPETAMKGLSGREALGENNAMLFVFSEDARYGFWMKDMHFSIDIIWLASDGTVVHVEKSVAPETYPTVFNPEKPVRYVLEIEAGRTDELGISLGDRVLSQEILMEIGSM